jgi:hypothetical protein
VSAKLFRRMLNDSIQDKITTETSVTWHDIIEPDLRGSKTRSTPPSAILRQHDVLCGVRGRDVVAVIALKHVISRAPLRVSLPAPNSTSLPVMTLFSALSLAVSAVEVVAVTFSTLAPSV